MIWIRRASAWLSHVNSRSIYPWCCSAYALGNVLYNIVIMDVQWTLDGYVKVFNCNHRAFVFIPTISVNDKLASKRMLSGN